MINLLSLGYVGVLIFSLAVNLIPFVGPSNLFIAGIAAISIPDANFLAIGLLAALGSTAAKMIHFYIAFFTSRVLKENQREKLDRYAKRAGKIGPVLIFLAAATPVPDDPLVIPLGLMKYNPLKFSIIYFLGKSTITIAGAYIGLYTKIVLGGLMDNIAIAAVSIAVTIASTLLLIKFDLEKLLKPSLARFLRRLDGGHPSSTSE